MSQLSRKCLKIFKDLIKFPKRIENVRRNRCRFIVKFSDFVLNWTYKVSKLKRRKKRVLFLSNLRLFLIQSNFQSFKHKARWRSGESVSFSFERSRIPIRVPDFCDLRFKSSMMTLSRIGEVRINGSVCSVIDCGQQQVGAITDSIGSVSKQL